VTIHQLFGAFLGFVFGHAANVVPESDVAIWAEDKHVIIQQGRAPLQFFHFGTLLLFKGLQWWNQYKPINFGVNSPK
jgi:hypothetical protein